MSEEEAMTEPPNALVLSFDTELNYKKICTCYNLILQNIPYIATHADIVCPVAKGKFKPDVGSFIALFETATSGCRPTVVGKPTEYAVSYISKHTQTPIDRIAFIGDRLYTDIRMALNFGMLSILTLSGETNQEMLRHSKDQPRIVINSVADLTPYL